VALVWSNAGFFAWRALSRMYFTTRLYGWRHGLVSLPRMVIGNFVNCMAVGRAWRMYLASVFFGRKLVWDKTAHEFPTGEQLVRSHRKLGELLQTWQALDAERLEQALQQQAQQPAPLGQVLIANGWLDEETLAEAIAYQADLPRAPLTADLVQEHAQGFPMSLSQRLRAIYVGTSPTGQPVLAVAAPLSADAIAEATQQLGSAPVQRIARDSEITAALDLLCAQAGMPAAVHDEALGEALAAAGAVDRHAYESALREYRPEEHGRVGDFLVERGVILKEMLESVLQQRDVGAVGA
jgi:adsorption protein B